MSAFYIDLVENNMNRGKVIAEELNLKDWQVEKAIELIDEGNTIPFISRYRKEVTGSLNDEQLRSLDERLTYLRNLEEKKATVLSTIEEQGKLTDELKKQIEEAMTMVVLEDLYRPYRPKRRTRATIAKEKGLEGLANIIALQMTKKTIEEEAQAYLSEEKEVNTVEDAIAGAKDILAENYADEAEYRKVIRELTREKGKLITTAKDKEASSVYEMYYEFEDDIKKLTGYRVLAINRGEAEKFITVKISAPVEEIINYLNKTIVYRPEHESAKYIEEAVADSYDRLIAPSIEREIRNELTEAAEEGAINVFGKNLHQLLMQPPVAGHTVLGWDPGYNHGSKLAIVDPTGKVLDTVIIYPTMGKKRELEAREVLKKLIAKYKVTLISLGNGTASRESEALIVDLLKEIGKDIKYVIVNEAGASIYSASKAASEEFPDFDEWQRSAASIARRIQDPLAELVKIDPKSIGVGQYQHDMNQKNLDNALTAVVEDCVNNVGVDLNTASPQLLSYISGISKPIAKNIVTYRENNGRFTSRKDLLKVPKLGPKAFEQCAGFMRITGGDEALDSTSVHPESYEATKLLMKKLNISEEDIRSGGIKGNTITSMVKDTKKTAEEIGLGEPTLIDILKELEKPGRDPREELEKPILRNDVLEMKDLTVGMQLKGTVRNVIDFGAFVDIGVHQDGLVHISKLSKKYIKHPLEVVSVGDIVDVTVIGVDLDKKRIQLSMVD